MLIVMMWEALQHKTDTSFTAKPDLIVIDGGKGQLSSVMSVMKNMEVDIPVIGLAKREEEVFVPERSEPIIFHKDSPAKFLLMRLRDEAHRSANRHREGRGFKAMKASFLDDVPGIGDSTKQELLRTFKTLSAIEAASDDDLKNILTEAQLTTLRDELAYRRSRKNEK
jgi:excinuclease ABC subunit C